jgi:hypothetical protein
MPNASRRKPVFRAPKRIPKAVEQQTTVGELPLCELRDLNYESKRRLAAQFTLEQADAHERVLLLIVSTVYRKLRSLHGAHNAPGESFLIELIEQAGRDQLHYHLVWDEFRQFESDWLLRAEAMQLGAEDGQDPNDDDPVTNAEIARMEKWTINLPSPPKANGALASPGL